MADSEAVSIRSSHFDCPITTALRIINPKWSMPILYELFHASGPVRFNALERALSPVTQKELSKRLRDLEEEGVIKRVVYAEVPPRVEYSLTTSGKALVPLLDSLRDWSSEFALAEGTLSEDLPLATLLA